NELYNIICEWNLDNKVCIIITNNGANVVKRIRLLDEVHLLQVSRQSCVAHILQLSVKEGLKQDNETISPLEVLIDCKTRWSSSYLAWKRILELHLAMWTLAASLQNKSDAALKKEGEKLDQLCLTSEEK
ncbi:16035_t:CDS:2, partial [Cetraspora pellucida]